MARRSAPFCNKCVAKECRNVCAAYAFLKPYCQKQAGFIHGKIHGAVTLPLRFKNNIVSSKTFFDCHMYGVFLSIDIYVFSC